MSLSTDIHQSTVFNVSLYRHPPINCVQCLSLQTSTNQLCSMSLSTDIHQSTVFNVSLYRHPPINCVQCLSLQTSTNQLCSMSLSTDIHQSTVFNVSPYRHPPINCVQCLSIQISTNQLCSMSLPTDIHQSTVFNVSPYRHPPINRVQCLSLQTSTNQLCSMSLHTGILPGSSDHYNYTTCYTNRNVLHGEDNAFSAGNYCGYALRDIDRMAKDGNGTYSTHLYTQRATQVVEDVARSGKVRPPMSVETLSCTLLFYGRA